MDDEPDFTPPEGWTLQSHTETFSGRAGPYYFREESPTPGVGFFARSEHMNLGGVIHGGALMTLADMSLWDICRRKVGPFRGVTVTMNAEFLRPGPTGCFVEATGETLAVGKRMLFARGLVTAKGKTLLSFSGSLKRLD
jgi:uncharacterized protein (TIGR00369 family)